MNLWNRLRCNHKVVFTSNICAVSLAIKLLKQTRPVFVYAFVSVQTVSVPVTVGELDRIG